MRALRLAGLAAAVLGGFAAAAILLPHSPIALRHLVLATGAAAPLIAIAAWITLTPALFSGTVLAAATGLAFGAVDGALLAAAGAVLGGLAAFGLARTLAREWARRLLERPRFAKVDDLLERCGFAAVLTARLAPGVPATALHYLAGASPVRTTAFAAAIGIGALLRTVPYALLGDGIAAGSPVGVAVAAASIALGGLCATLIVRRLRAIPAA